MTETTEKAASNVTPITPGVEIKSQPVEGNVVAQLEALLVAAKAGDIRAIAFALVRATGGTSRGWARPATGEHTNAMVAGVGDLFFSVHAERDNSYSEGSK
jgi:hypothetical protein